MSGIPDCYDTSYTHMQYCHAYLSAFPGEMGARVDKFELRDSKLSNSPPWGYSLARVTNKPRYGGTLKEGISRFILKVVSPLRKYCSFIKLGTLVIFFKLDYLQSCMKAQCCVKIGIKLRQLRTVMSTCVCSVLIQYVPQQTLRKLGYCFRRLRCLTEYNTHACGAQGST